MDQATWESVEPEIRRRIEEVVLCRLQTATVQSGQIHQRREGETNGQIRHLTTQIMDLQRQLERCNGEQFSEHPSPGSHHSGSTPTVPVSTWGPWHAHGGNLAGDKQKGNASSQTMGGNGVPPASVQPIQPSVQSNSYLQPSAPSGSNQKGDDGSSGNVPPYQDGSLLKFMGMKEGEIVLVTDKLSMRHYEDQARVIRESSTRTLMQSWNQPFPLPESIVVAFIEGPYAPHQKEAPGNLCRKLPGPGEREQNRRPSSGSVMGRNNPTLTTGVPGTAHEPPPAAMQAPPVQTMDSSTGQAAPTPAPMAPEPPSHTMAPQGGGGGINAFSPSLSHIQSQQLAPGVVSQGGASPQEQQQVPRHLQARPPPLTFGQPAASYSGAGGGGTGPPHNGFSDITKYPAHSSNL